MDGFLKRMLGRNARKRWFRRQDFTFTGRPAASDNGKSVFTRSSRHFIGKLMKKGFERVGHGYYSEVLAKPNSNKVIKVHHGEEDGWIHYVKWAAENGYAGNLAPKVTSFKKYPQFYVAIVERLKTTARDIEPNHPLAVFEGLFNYAAKHANDNARLFCDLLVPKMGEFSEKLRKAFPEYRLDLHGGNLMLRDDNSVVVIDPLAGIRHRRIDSDGENIPYEERVTCDARPIPQRLRARDFLAA